MTESVTNVLQFVLFAEFYPVKNSEQQQADYEPAQMVKEGISPAQVQ